MYLRALAVFLLAFIAGGESCCEPKEYSKDFTLLMMGQVPMGPPPHAPTGNVSARFTGSLKMNWNEPSLALDLDGTVNMPTGNGGSMPVPVSAKLGVVKEGDQTKIWAQITTPVLGPTQCKYVTINGDLPDSARCIPKTFKKTGDRSYEVKVAPFFRQVYSVDESCSMASTQISLNVPQNNMKMFVQMTATNTELSAGNIDNQVPANCQYSTTIPSNVVRQASNTGGASIITTAMAGGGPSAGRRSVLHDMAKRTLDQFMKRENQKRQVKENFHELTRSLRSALDHMFK